jgi:DNA-binding response OmpR family regulator
MKKIILIIDDSPMVLAVTQRALEGAGYQVAVADNLETFEAHRKSQPPDLILVDVQMPEAFGDDVAGTLRMLHQVKVPILLVSSLDDRDLAERARDAQIDGFVSKRAGIKELVRHVREVIGT